METIALILLVTILALVATVTGNEEREAWKYIIEGAKEEWKAVARKDHAEEKGSKEVQ